MKKISLVSIFTGTLMTVFLLLSTFMVPGTVRAVETSKATINVSDTSADFVITLSDDIKSGVNVVIKCFRCNNGNDIRVVATKSPYKSTIYKGTFSGLTPEKAYTYEVFSDDNASVEPHEGEFITLPAGMKTGPTGPITAPIELKLDNPLGTTTTLPAFMVKVLDGAILLLTPVVVIMLLYAGFLFVSAQGNAEKLSTAKKVLLYTIIGAAIILGCKGLAIVLQSAVGCVAGASGC